MTVEYGPKGLIGLLTPQANTTAEPECGILWPSGYAMISARMTSDCQTLPERLVDYVDRVDETLRQFHNAPVDALSFACTGSAYLIGTAREDALIERLSGRLGVPFVSAGRAVTTALNALGARRIGLLSPYPSDLTEAAVPYWTSRGFEVAAVAGTVVDNSSFHAIYTIRSETASEALAAFEGKKLDAVIMLGTGMPTLKTILGAPTIGGASVLSCNLALAWATIAAIERRSPAAADLRAWIAGDGWRARYAERFSG